MNEYDNVATVKAFYAAFQQSNIPGLLEYLTPDIKWFAVGPPRVIPTAGTRYGRNQVAQYFFILSETEEIHTFQANEFIAEGNVVVAIGTLETRLKDTGKILRTPWVHVFGFYRGKVSEFRSFYDSDAAAEAHLNEHFIAVAG